MASSYPALASDLAAPNGGLPPLAESPAMIDRHD
jgi:hypothetical protein